MSPALLGILLWLVVRAVRARRSGSRMAGASTLPSNALPIMALPRATLVVVVSMFGAILAAGANGRPALETLDGLLIIAGLAALGLRLVPRLPPVLGWGAKITLAVAGGNLLGLVLEGMVQGKR